MNNIQQNSNDHTVLYNSKAILFLYTLLALKACNNDTVNKIISEMTHAKKNKRYRIALDKIIRRV